MSRDSTRSEADVVVRMRALHPAPPEVASARNVLERAFAIDVPMTAEALWESVADTSRFNRALGLGEMTFEERDGLLHGTSRTLGQLQAWVEVPWSWVRRRHLTSLRRFSRGPSRATYAAYHLEPLDDGRATRLSVYFALVPRGPIRGLLLSLGLRWLEKRYRDVIGGFARATVATALLAPPPASPPPGALAKLEASVAELRARNLEARSIEALVDHVLGGDELDLDRIAPLERARKNGIDEHRFVETCLHATRIGLLDMRWDVVCPRCRGVRASVTQLGDVPAESRCDVCDVEFDTSDAHAIEVTFRPHPSIRPIEHRFYCSAEPATKPHIEVQLVLGPGVTATVPTRLRPGRHRLRLRGREAMRFLDVVPTAPASGDVALEVRADDDRDDALVATEDATIRFRGDASKETTFVIETPTWSDSALRPGQLLGMQGFRDLFSEQTLATGMRLEVGTQTVMFTDVVGSTAFYTTHGDPTAFAIVKAHFDTLYTLVARHRGVVVKTIGDATMTVFADPRDAVEVAEAIQRSFGDDPSPTAIRLRIAMHTGPCIVVQFHQGLDYFGGTVNLAAKLQSLASAGEIVVSEATFASPGVAARLASDGGRVEDVTYRSAAFVAPVPAKRWTPHPPAAETTR